MTAALSDFPPSGAWTTDDLEAMPEDGLRRELLDGVLLVSPSPTNIHQIIAGRLMVALEANCPLDKQVTQAVDIRLDARRSFCPDVLVITSDAARRTGRLYAPHEVVLAVEIVSPTSQSMDRITKPALFAGAGIPYYWRIETEDEIVVHTYRIDPVHEIYEPAGTFRDVIDTPQPWAIEIPISKLTPRDF